MTAATHTYRGDVGTYAVTLAPAKRGFASNVQQVTIVHHVDGEQTIPDGATVAVLKSRVTEQEATPS